MAFATRRVLRIHDRLVFNGRFFAEHVEAEVRVTSLRDGANGRTIAGCAFVDINAAQRARVQRLVAAADSPPERPAGVDVGTPARSGRREPTPTAGAASSAAASATAGSDPMFTL